MARMDYTTLHDTWRDKGSNAKKPPASFSTIITRMTAPAEREDDDVIRDLLRREGYIAGLGVLFLEKQHDFLGLHGSEYLGAVLTEAGSKAFELGYKMEVPEVVDEDFASGLTSETAKELRGYRSGFVTRCIRIGYEFCPDELPGVPATAEQFGQFKMGVNGIGPDTPVYNDMLSFERAQSAYRLGGRFTSLKSKLSKALLMES